MTLDSLRGVLSDSLRAEVDLRRRGMNDYRVDVPFYFSDGDGVKIILKDHGDGDYTLTDEGHTLMRLSYQDLDLDGSPARRSLFEKILSSHFLKNQDGRLALTDIREADLGSAIFTFAQGVMKVADMAFFLKRERMRNLFIEELKALVAEVIGERKAVFDYCNPDIDADRKYPIDCLIVERRDRRVHLYGAHTDVKAKDSMLSMYYYAGAGDKTPSCVVFDAEGSVGNKTKAQVADIADKTISSIGAIRETLPRFVEKFEDVA